jgi:acyl carrier protein/NAD(P)-dependent dehydrogenase (short-subunit alcohol dehydrogenase family)
LVERLEQIGKQVIQVKAGESFAKLGDCQYVLNPQENHGYEALLNDLRVLDRLPKTIVHLWNVTRNEHQQNESLLERLDESQNLGIFSLLALAQAIGKMPGNNNFRIEIVSNNLHEVTGEESLDPEKATILGPCKVIPLEYANTQCRSIDMSLPDLTSTSKEKAINQLLAELSSDSPDSIVAYRGHYRWVPSFEAVHLADTNLRSARLRKNGVYLIVGGLGGIALELAQYMARAVQAKMILTARSEFPARGDWTHWLDTHDENNNTSQKIKKLMAIEDAGGEVFITQADIVDLKKMKEIFFKSLERFGRINGVIHNAGVIDQAGMIQRRSREMTAGGLESKVRGTLVLNKVLQETDTQLDFLCLFSSIASELYHNRFGQVSYVAANSFLDVYAYYKTSKESTFTVTINWDDWQGIGMSAQAREQFAEKFGGEQLGDPLDKFTPAEGITVFKRIMNNSFPRVVVSTRDFGIRLSHDLSVSSPFLKAASNADLSKQQHSRPDLSSTYVAPSNEMEKTIVGIWQEVLGVEDVGIDDDYFELGGDSLMAAQFIARLQEAFEVEIPLQTLFEAPTVKSMVERIETLLWANQGTKDTFGQSEINLVEGEI